MPCRNHPDVEYPLIECARCGERFCQNCVVEIRGKPFCADCKLEQVQDMKSGTDEFELDLAGVGRRFGAIFLDGIIVGVFNQIIIAGVLSGFVSGLGPGATPQELADNVAQVMAVSYALGLGIPILYEALMLGWRGQTLGKMAFRVKVVTPDGGDITHGQAWLRALMKQILALPLLLTYWFGFGRERRTLHDRIAGTRVVNWRQ